MHTWDKQWWSVIGHWEHKHMQLSQALHTSDESSEPALATHITSSCDLSWRVVLIAGQSVTSTQKVIIFVSRVFSETKSQKGPKKLSNVLTRSLFFVK